MKFRRCYYEHVKLIKPQAAQSSDVRFFIEQMATLAEEGVAMSAWVSERCVAAAGVWPQNAYRAVAWAVLSDEACRHLFPILRRMDFVLTHYPAKRFEMTVEAGFQQGHRMASLLGFYCETPNGMPYFFPHGAGAYLYARIKP